MELNVPTSIHAICIYFILLLILPSLFIVNDNWNSNIEYYISSFSFTWECWNFHHLNYLLYYLNCRGKETNWNWNCWGNGIKTKTSPNPEILSKKVLEKENHYVIGYVLIKM